MCFQGRIAEGGDRAFGVLEFFCRDKYRTRLRLVWAWTATDPAGILVNTDAGSVMYADFLARVSDHGELLLAVAWQRQWHYGDGVYIDQQFLRDQRLRP